MPDARTEKTQRAIKDALLQLLGEKSFDRIGMSELAKRAEISRSTLYQHYPNLQLAFDALVQDFQATLQPLSTQLKCQNGQEQPTTRVPYCRALRNAGTYAALVRDPHYLPTMLRISSTDGSSERALKPYLDAGLDPRSAERMFTFQMTACYNAALSVESDEEWVAMQRTIDQFIAGGLNALRQR